MNPVDCSIPVAVPLGCKPLKKPVKNHYVAIFEQHHTAMCAEHPKPLKAMFMLSYCKFYMTSVVKAFINMYFLHAFWDTCFSVQCLAATIKKTQLNCVGGPLYGLTANLRHEFLKRSTEELLRYILLQYIRFQKSSFHFIKGCWNRGFQVEEWLKASRTEGKKERAR